ncbi:TPM domain-containing protein [Caldimonas tepidiphila]|uniref:TPM domain-containing protein n=1 Tax=Caldimonas tepidiphila TaxID=2315841 RepID=UPI000E5A5023|nr:TPM domain-containing protein [Caldimonas tepidiphila]
MTRKLLRLLRHCWTDAEDARRTIGDTVLERLGRRVAAGEASHSGELRICIEAGLPLSYLWRDEPIEVVAHERALALFGKLRVWDTENNNGVLIYLLLVEHRIEIIADRGLARHVPPAQWQALVQEMGAAFRRGDYEGGLGRAIDTVSALLDRHFPLAPGERNPDELPNAPHLI